MARRKPSADLSVEPDEIPKAPPQAHFEPVAAALTTATERGFEIRNGRHRRFRKLLRQYTRLSSSNYECRAGETPQDRGESRRSRRRANETGPAGFGKRWEHAVVGEPGMEKSPAYPAGSGWTATSTPVCSRGNPDRLAFTGMLLATHRYVTSTWNPLPASRR